MADEMQAIMHRKLNNFRYFKRKIKDIYELSKPNDTATNKNA